MSQININQVSGEVASVGELGTSRRDDRLYHNATIYHTDISSVSEVFDDLESQLDLETGHPIGRVVFRGIVSPEVISEIFRSDLGGHVEVAQPLQSYNERGWLIYLSKNALGRDAIVPMPEMIDETEGYIVPLNFNSHELPQEFTHLDHIPKEYISQLHELWSAFGWQVDGVAERAQKVTENLGRDPAERNTWFSGLCNAGRLVCAATAERLACPGANGPFSIVESTEWRTHPEYIQHGLMGHNLWRLNASIITDLSDGGGCIPLIFAECNYMTRADKAGRRAGFAIPSRQFASQIIVQNVIVDDGHEPRGLRDFSFLSLPARYVEL